MKVWISLLIIGTIIPLHAENLLKNHSFTSRNGIFPDQWIRLQGTPFDKCFKTENGILRISEQTPNYFNAIAQEIPIEPSQSYYFEIEYKMDAQINPAGIFYTFLDENGRKLQPERFLLYTKEERKDWTKFSSVISIPDPLKTRSIKLAFVNYSKGRNPDNAIYFRNPVLEVYTNQKIIRPVQNKTVSKEKLPAILFTHNLTNAPSGVPYQLEKEEIGFLRLDTNVLKSQAVNLEIEAPDGISFELYLHKGKQGNIQIPKSSAGKEKTVFHIPFGCVWPTWSNTLLFSASRNVPDQFEIKLKFTAVAEKQSWNYTVPVKQIPSPQVNRLPEHFAYSAWQAFPVTRIDLNNPANRLAILLNENWRRSGWKHNPELRATRYIPYRPSQWKGPKINIPEGRSISGAPVDLFCDTALIEAGPDFYADLIVRMKYEKQVKEAAQFELDYEPYTQGPVTISCFCEKCITAFAKEFKLPGELTGIEILRKHEKEWVKFRTRQRARMVETVVKGFKRINPAILFRFCSMPLPPRIKDEYEYFKTYGIDLRLYEPFTDIHTPMNYDDTLDFFRSLEREAAELKKTRATIVSNGWSDVSTKIPERCAFQLLAAFFCDNAYPVIGQGLFVAQGNIIAAIKAMMNDIAATETLWMTGTLDTAEKIKVQKGFLAENNFYHFSRTAPDGRKWILAINNSRNDNVYARIQLPRGGMEAADLLNRKVIIPENDSFNVKLHPLEYRLIQLSPEAKHQGWQKENSAQITGEENTAIAEWQKSCQSITKNGIDCCMNPDGYEINTPAQKIIFNIRKAAEGCWSVKGKPAATSIGRCFFMDRGAVSLTDLPAVLESCKILKDGVTVTFSSQVKTRPYDGLVIRKTFTIYRDIPKVIVKLAIVPEKGFRMFRCRAVTEITAGKEIKSLKTYANRIKYLVGKIEDHSGNHVSFVRKDAIFPNNEPFLKRFTKTILPLKGNSFIATEMQTGNRIKIIANNIDQLFCWRTHNCATMELIWPDAYPHFDPHLIRTWEVVYTLEYIH